MEPFETHPSLRVGVVGATGLVGRTMLQVLLERGVPPSSIRCFASQRSAGLTVEVGGNRWPVEAAEPAVFADLDLALFSAGAEVSRQLAPQAASAGCTVIDNSAAWRMDPTVPLVVSQVNPDDLGDHQGIIANPNCSTMQLAPLLAALRDAVGLQRVVVDTYQAVSGTGSEAVAELEEQIAAHAAGRSIQPRVYPHPIGFNCLPEIDVFLDDGYTKEEWKVINESRKILHLPDLRVSCTAVRVPVFVGHSEAVHVETAEPIDPREARRLFATIPGVVVEDEPTAHRYPLATTAAGRDEIFVGRIRQDLSLPEGRGLAFWVVADNLRKGAATNAVEIAQILLQRGWLAPASRRHEAAARQEAAARVGR
jgi:aspartate-semialdehyde dehydrogenase